MPSIFMLHQITFYNNNEEFKYSTGSSEPVSKSGDLVA